MMIIEKNVCMLKKKYAKNDMLETNSGTSEKKTTLANSHRKKHKYTWISQTSSEQCMNSIWKYGIVNSNLSSDSQYGNKWLVYGYKHHRRNSNQVQILYQQTIAIYCLNCLNNISISYFTTSSSQTLFFFKELAYYDLMRNGTCHTKMNTLFARIHHTAIKKNVQLCFFL